MFILDPCRNPPTARILALLRLKRSAGDHAASVLVTAFVFDTVPARDLMGLTAHSSAGHVTALPRAPSPHHTLLRDRLARFVCSNNNHKRFNVTGLVGARRLVRGQTRLADVKPTLQHLRLSGFAARATYFYKYPSCQIQPSSPCLWRCVSAETVARACPKKVL